MTDFVIVIAAAAALAAPVAPGSTAQAGAAAASSVPLSAPTVGFRTYADAASCRQALRLRAGRADGGGDGQRLLTRCSSRAPR